MMLVYLVYNKDIVIIKLTTIVFGIYSDYGIEYAKIIIIIAKNHISYWNSPS